MTFIHKILVQTSRPQNDERRPLACSALIKSEHRDLINMRRLCEDRKGFFDHLHPRRLTKSTVRLLFLQSSQVMTAYMQDQLKEDIRRDELVADGKLTRREADHESDEWGEKEWTKRWETFPHRMTVAFAKYHSIIFVMRIYEYVASQFVDDSTLDKLTLDTFEAAKRESRSTKDNVSLGREMVATCGYANVIAFLADYSVHQVLLLFGYYMYIREQQRQRRGDDPALHYGSLALSALTRSTYLAMARAFGLACASVGGALGSMVLPGWGTLAGTNLFDSLAASATDELTGSPPFG